MFDKNKFLEALEEEDNFTLTENLADTHRSTKSALLDFFAMGGALRSRDEKDIIRLFTKAFAENPLLATKCLFYFRDIRGGQGERRTFRTILNYMGTAYPSIVINNIESVPFFGRWDDLYSLFGTKCEGISTAFMFNQMELDREAEYPSLLGKWLKSENTSSKKSKKLASLTRKAFGMTHKDYRLTLSDLRRKIGIVESKMCANQWDKIEYPKVPSRAGLIYSKAFRRHDEERYEAFLNSVKKGEQKINVSVLYPYEIIRMVDREPDRVEEATVMWDNQKNWLEGSDEKAIVVCDTSGSMMGGYINRNSVAPIYVAVSLSMYFAERNKGVFHNKFITFSQAPKLQSIVGNNIWEKWDNLSRAEWDGNTNLQAVFDLILYTAKTHAVPKEDMPNKLYIISDMEFDSAVGYDFGYSYYRNQNRPKITNFDEIKRKYKQSGYEMPTLVFWNVESRQNNVPITKDERGVVLVSGCSPSIFETLMKGLENLTPYDLMLEVLNKERYNPITL